VALVIDEEGKVDSLTLQGTPIAMTQAILTDISAWQFKPATKNGKPVRVEVVLEIPYRLTPEIAQN
jgi:TonB-like protein